jgi:hypothetical protein
MRSLDKWDVRNRSHSLVKLHSREVGSQEGDVVVAQIDIIESKPHSPSPLGKPAVFMHSLSYIRGQTK